MIHKCTLVIKCVVTVVVLFYYHCVEKREKVGKYGLAKRKMVALEYLILRRLKVLLVRTWDIFHFLNL